MHIGYELLDETFTDAAYVGDFEDDDRADSEGDGGVSGESSPRTIQAIELGHLLIGGDVNTRFEAYGF